MITLQTDAAYQAKNKSAGLAGILSHQGQKETFQYFLTEVDDNHQAEFLALVKALDLIERMGWHSEIIIIKTDSQILASSINKRFVKSKSYQHLLAEILHYLDNYSESIITWVSENDNKQADYLAKQALHQQISSSQL